MPQTTSYYKIAIVGASGHGRVLADAVHQAGAGDVVGLVDDLLPIGEERYGFPVLGTIEGLAHLFNQGRINAVVLGVGFNFAREALYQRIKTATPDMQFPPVVHPSATVGPDVQLGEGVALLAMSSISSGARIEPGCLVNTGAHLGHESTLHAFASLAPGARTGGEVHIGARSAIGMGALLKPGLTVGHDTIVGMGACVVHPLEPLVVAYGNPARVVRSRQPHTPYLG